MLRHNLPDTGGRQSLNLANTVRKAAKLSGDLGIRTLDLQANIAALTERAATIEAARAGDNATDLTQLGRLLTTVSDDTNVLRQYIAESEVEIPDTPYIRFAAAMAADIASHIEREIAAGAPAPGSGAQPDRFLRPVGDRPQRFRRRPDARTLAAERADRIWNEEYSRHQQIFSHADMVGQSETTQPFLIKAYRRSVAGGAACCCSSR